MESLFAKHLHAHGEWVDRYHARTLFDAVRAILVSDTAFRHYLVASHLSGLPISEQNAREYERAMRDIANEQKNSDIGVCQPEDQPNTNQYTARKQ